MATTTNYSWITPDDTALVKDGAAAIRSLGTSVDTTTKALNPSTTLGDIEYRSSTANTNTRLGIGSTGQVLSVTGGVPSWVTLAGGGKNFSLLNAGGTALTGAQTITVSGISGKDSILVFVDGASSTNANSAISMRLNTDTTSKYWQAGNYMAIGASYSTNFAGGAEGYYTPTGDTRIGLGNMGADTTHLVYGAAIFQGCNSTGGKVFNVNGGVSYLNATPIMFNTSGVYTGTSTISSISLFTNSGTFDSGTVYVYASA